MNGVQDIAQLVSRVALRDRAAFRQLYAQTSAKLFGVTLRILKDRAESEDALQEVFVKIWQRSPTFRDTEYSPVSWLVAIARNHAIDILRARRGISVELDEAMELVDLGPDPERATVQASEKRRLDKCLETLDTADAIRGAYMDGYSYEELATRFGVPLNTMRTWLRRGLLKLRACLEQNP